ncbi:hypothetical protein PG994_010853 [Apiospora phragmitis]|uniref:Transcription factor domain-containing protein n=1 Tax=Apiospora phragmitis TaxID=2905665 RepID=A0ABR1TR56_9PEZI
MRITYANTGSLIVGIEKLSPRSKNPLSPPRRQRSRKDKTLVEILDRLRSLENKVDNISLGGTCPPASGYETRSPNPPGPTTVTLAPDARDQPCATPWHTSGVHSPAPLGHAASRQMHYSYSSASYKVLSWPFVQQFLGASKNIAAMVEPLVKKNGAAVVLDLHARATPLPQDTFDMAASRKGSAAPNIEVPLKNPSGGLHMDPMSFSWENMHRLSKAYFDTFNLLYPFMDRAQFQTEILSSVAANGIRREPELDAGVPSPRERASILACFEFWRMTTSASLACQALLTSNPEELKSHRADLVRRMFWHCIMTETYLNLEFNLPLTGLEKVDDMVGLPDFSAGSFSEEDYIDNQASHFQEHFASQIVLGRLLVEFHTSLTCALGAAGTRQSSIQAADNNLASTNPATTIKHLAAQLDRWRGMLPSHLGWQDNYTNRGHVYPPAGTESLLHRPFLFKALHYPESITHEDAEGVAIALKSTLRNQKWLIPCLYCWSQEFLAMLLLLHLSQQVPILVGIRATHLGDDFDADAKQTTALYIDWISDLKDIDPTARWCWSILKEVYSLEE